MSSHNIKTMVATVPLWMGKPCHSMLWSRKYHNNKDMLLSLYTFTYIWFLVLHFLTYFQGEKSKVGWIIIFIKSIQVWVFCSNLYTWVIKFIICLDILKTNYVWFIMFEKKSIDWSARRLWLVLMKILYIRCCKFIPQAP